MNNIKPFVFENGNLVSVAAYRSTTDNKIKIAARFISNNGNIDETVLFDYSVLKSKQSLQKIIPDGFIYDSLPNSKFMSELKQYFEESVDKLPLGVIAPPGYSLLLSGEYIYALGDKIIPKSLRKHAIAGNPNDYRFTISESSDEDILRWICTYISQGNYAAVLFLHHLAARLGIILEELSLSPTHAYLYADTDMGKTTEEGLLSDIYTNKKAGLHISTDKKKIFESISFCRDEPFLLDDLNKTDSKEQKRKREEKVCDIIHTASTGGAISINNNIIDARRIGFTFTAEYLLDNPSTLNRCIIIHMDKPFRKSTVDFLIENRSAYTAFLYEFIEWICLNADRLKAAVKLLNPSVPYFENIKEARGKNRISSSYKTLYVTKMILLNYLDEKCKISDLPRDKLSQIFDLGITNIIDDTISCCIPKKEFSRADMIINELLELLLNPKSELKAKNHKKYYLNDRYLFFKHKIKNNKHFCFQSKKFAKHLFLKRQIDVSYKEVISVLAGAGLLTFNGLEPTRKLSNDLGDNSKYCCILKSKITGIVEAYQEEMNGKIGDILDSEIKL